MISVPVLGPAVPRTHGPFVALLGRKSLELAGWRLEGNFPDVPKMVLIVAPHTSNWDFPVGLMAKFALRLGCRFIAKHSLFWWPLGAFLRAVGGIPINRAAAADLKFVRLGPAFPATADYESDLAAIQSHIGAAMAKHPERYGQDRSLK